MNTIKIVAPTGFFGANENDKRLDVFLREFSERYSTDEREWAEKYGTHYIGEKATMNPFCWCEKDDCYHCGVLSATEKEIKEHGLNHDKDNDLYFAPNFWYKPLDFRVWWYKYIGRGVEVNRSISDKEFYDMQYDLLG